MVGAACLGEGVWPQPGGESLQAVVGQPGGLSLSHLLPRHDRGRPGPHGHRD